jgi:hypothetical protein
MIISLSPEKKAELLAFLYTPCPLEEVQTDENGGQYLPIEVVKRKLEWIEEYFGLRVWQSDFKHEYQPWNKELIVSGSLTIEFLDFRLVGAATFPASRFGANKHFAPTLKSLCVTNALSWRFPAFGSQLNQNDGVTIPEKEEGVEASENDKLLASRLTRVLLNCQTQSEYKKVLSQSTPNIIAMLGEDAKLHGEKLGLPFS